LKIWRLIIANIITTIVIFFIVLGLYGYILFTIPDSTISALKIGATSLVTALPLIILAFALVGALQVILPRTFFVKYLSEQAGVKGIFIGSLLGGIIPGPPYIWLSIAAALLKSGAGTGMVISFLCASTIWNFDLLPLEISFLGTRFVVIKVISTIIFPPVAGIIVHILSIKLSL